MMVAPDEHDLSGALVINFVPTGMLPSRASNPHVPLRPAEIIREVCDAAELGITIAHLHARDQDERPTADPDVHAEIISGIRERCPELVLCVSTSARQTADPAARAAVLRLAGNVKPDMASLTLSSMNFSRQASCSSPEDIRYLCEQMLAHGVMPELEAFDLGMLNYARYLTARRLLRPPFYFNLMLGNIASAQCDLVHAGMLVRELPRESVWAFGAVGPQQLSATAFAIAAGGGVRIGLEDNLYLDFDRRVAATNRQLLERVHTIARIFSRAIMTPAEFRSRMQLRMPRDGYGREPIRAETDLPLAP